MELDQQTEQNTTQQAPACTLSQPTGRDTMQTESHPTQQTALTPTANAHHQAAKARAETATAANQHLQRQLAELQQAQQEAAKAAEEQQKLQNQLAAIR